jgi:chorismate mutase
MISADLVGCSTARNKGTCSNRLNIRRDRVEVRVLNALRDRLMDPALFTVFCEELTKEVNRARIEARTSLEAARHEIERINRELKKLVQAIMDGVPALSPLSSRGPPSR